MLIDCVPITWFRSTAVWALASSTIALTSARAATPRFFATRVAPPAQATSPPWTSNCNTEKLVPALIPSTIRMLPRIRFEMRWVWPTIMASTVVS
jgi:hypothetical protein